MFSCLNSIGWQSYANCFPCHEFVLDNVLFIAGILMKAGFSCVVKESAALQLLRPMAGGVQQAANA